MATSGPKITPEGFQGVSRYSNLGVTRPEVVNPSAMFAQSLGGVANALTGFGNLYSGLKRLGMEKEKHQSDQANKMMELRKQMSKEEWASAQGVLQEQFGLSEEDHQHFMDMDLIQDKYREQMDVVLGEGDPEARMAKSESLQTPKEIQDTPTGQTPEQVAMDTSLRSFRGAGQTDDMAATEGPVPTEVRIEDLPASPEEVGYPPTSKNLYDEHIQSSSQRAREVERNVPPEIQREQDHALGRVQKAMTKGAVMAAFMSGDQNAIRELMADPMTSYTLAETEANIEKATRIELAKKGLHDRQDLIQGDTAMRYAMWQALPLMGHLPEEDMSKLREYVEPIDQMMEEHKDDPGLWYALESVSKKQMEMVGNQLPYMQNFVLAKMQDKTQRDLHGNRISHELAMQAEKTKQWEREMKELRLPQLEINRKQANAQAQSLQVNTSLSIMDAHRRAALGEFHIYGEQLKTIAMERELMNQFIMDAEFPATEQVARKRLQESFSILGGISEVVAMNPALLYQEDGPGVVLRKAISDTTRSTLEELKNVSNSQGGKRTMTLSDGTELAFASAPEMFLEMDALGKIKLPEKQKNFFRSILPYVPTYDPNSPTGIKGANARHNQWYKGHDAIESAMNLMLDSGSAKLTPSEFKAQFQSAWDASTDDQRKSNEGVVKVGQLLRNDVMLSRAYDAYAIRWDMTKGK